jgi:flagellar biosynthesis protein
MTDKPEEAAPPYAPLKPAHGRSVAVAIQGTDGKPDSFPKIIASGRGKVAEQILELAFAKGLKVREDADLAELLAQLDLDTPIPSEAIIAVAEILAKVYECNARPASGASQEKES